jgi:hypothetical protein
MRDQKITVEIFLATFNSLTKKEQDIYLSELVKDKSLRDDIMDIVMTDDTSKDKSKRKTMENKFRRSSKKKISPEEAKRRQEETNEAFLASIPIMHLRAALLRQSALEDIQILSRGYKHTLV